MKEKVDVLADIIIPAGLLTSAIVHQVNRPSRLNLSLLILAIITALLSAMSLTMAHISAKREAADEIAAAVVPSKHEVS